MSTIESLPTPEFDHRQTADKMPALMTPDTEAPEVDAAYKDAAVFIDLEEAHRELDIDDQDRAFKDYVRTSKEKEAALLARSEAERADTYKVLAPHRINEK